MAPNTPNFNTPIPEKIMTPDRVPTRLGTLEFFDGMPTDATAAVVLEHLTFLRGVEVFLSAIPAASLEAMRAGLEGFGATASNKVVIFDELADSNSLFLTGNTDTVYALALLDLDRDGPTVVEIPPGCGPGTVDDAWFRFVIDMGAPGPDRGQGGKYLILPPGYDGEVPDGYFTATSTSYVNWIALRGFLVDGRPDAASQMFRNGIKIYPLARRDDPPAMEFLNASGQTFNTIHANNVEFYEEVHTVIDREPVDMIDPETRGLLASIGIRKGQPFATRRTAAGDPGRRRRGRQRHRPRGVLPDAGGRQLPVRGQLLEARLLRRQLPVPPRRRRRQRTQPRRPHRLLLHGHGQHPGDGDEDGRPRLAVRMR